jgi:hypothetical protein
MADFLLVVDSVTGKRKARTSGSFTDYDFDVGIGGQTVFSVGEDVTAGTKLDMFWNGRLLREGGSYDYTRDNTADTLTSLVTIPQNAWVRIRVYSF